MRVTIDERIKDICPAMQIGIVRAKVVNSITNEGLWAELVEAGEDIKSRYEILEINNRPAIAKTRELYKRLGKDPNRYRVSSEALCRRIIRGMELYRINALVDLINLISVKSGYAIGGFDAGKIAGDLTLGVGMNGEHFEAIGRGVLNIEGLPVYRDAIGGIGTPTSDEERTKITLDTTFLHMNINAFAEEMPLQETVDWTVGLLRKYAQATEVEVMYN